MSQHYSDVVLMTGWFAPGVFAGLCLLTLPVVLVVAWVVRLTWDAAYARLQAKFRTRYGI